MTFVESTQISKLSRVNLLALCNCDILTPKSLKFFYGAISICFRTTKKTGGLFVFVHYTPQKSKQVFNEH